MSWLLRGAALCLCGLAGLTGCSSDSARPLYVDQLSTVADSVFLAVGESIDLTFEPRDNRGEPLPDRRPFVRLSVPSASAVSISDTLGAQVTITGLSAGSSSVTAALGRGLLTIPVHVSPPGLASISIEPSPVVVPRGARVRVDVVLRDAAGDVIAPDGFRFTWTLEPSILGVTQPNEPFTEIFGSSQLAPGTTLSVKVSRFSASAQVILN